VPVGTYLAAVVAHDPSKAPLALGLMKEDGKPIQIGLRLKIKNGRITEAGHRAT
jgi:hypothetical protein